MEDSKKKKRNKKKNKQGNKVAEYTAATSNGEGGAASMSQQSDLSNGQKHQGKPVGAATENGGVEANKHHANGSVPSNFDLAEEETQHRLKIEASLEETINQLRSENDLHLQKESDLEVKVVQLQSEKESWQHKEVSLEGKIGLLSDDKASLELKQCSTNERTSQIAQSQCDPLQESLKEKVSLEETITHLRSENDLHLQKESDLEVKVAQLQREKESWQHKEASLEGKIDLLSDVKASLELKQESLEEKIRQLERDYDSSILKEKSNEETVSNKEMELTKLRLQVGELEESKNVSNQENQRLTDIMSGLQAQIQSLESSSISAAHALDEQIKHSSEYDVLNSQLEGACQLVEKLITENSELVEKMNELYLKLDHQTASSRHSSPVQYDSILGRDETITFVPDRRSVSSKNLLLLAEETEPSPEIVIARDEPIPGDSTVMSNSFDSGEIVQIPLDGYEVQTLDVQSEGADNDSKAAIPLSDAPLIGAPFRFISFVTGYVSGADLVDRNSTSRN